MWVIERTGAKLNSKILMNINPIPNCENLDCLLCPYKTKYNCFKASVVYKIICLKCKDIIKYTYNGETSKSAYTRGSEHFRDLNKHDDATPLYKHHLNYHNINDPVSTKDYKMSIVEHYMHDSQGRVIREALEITNTDPEHRMNSKAEFRQPQIVKAAYTQ